MQQIVLLDAVGTVIAPSPNAPAVYEQVGRQFGSCLCKEEIAARFALAFKNHFHDSSYEQPANDMEDQLRWQRIVSEIFAEEFRPEMFEKLWQHFAHPGNWHVFPGVIQTISALQSKGFRVGIASNFDSRLCPICEQHLPMIQPERVYYSTQLGFAKPDVRFYTEIEKRIKQSSSDRLLMIGDNWRYDVDAAHRAGWRAIWKHGDSLPNVAEIEAHFFRKT